MAGLGIVLTSEIAREGVPYSLPPIIPSFAPSFYYVTEQVARTSRRCALLTPANSATLDHFPEGLWGLLRNSEFGPSRVAHVFEKPAVGSAPHGGCEECRYRVWLRPIGSKPATDCAVTCALAIAFE